MITLKMIGAACVMLLISSPVFAERQETLAKDPWSGNYRFDVGLAQVEGSNFGLGIWSPVVFGDFRVGLGLGFTNYYEIVENKMESVSGYVISGGFMGSSLVAKHQYLTTMLVIGYHDYPVHSEEYEGIDETDTAKFGFLDIRFGLETALAVGEGGDTRLGIGVGYKINFGDMERPRHVGDHQLHYSLVYPYVNLIAMTF